MNIVLFVVLIAIATWLAFGMGYASKDGYKKELLVIYSITAVLQIGVNYLVYKKQIVSDRKVLLKIIAIVTVMYILYLLVFSLKRINSR
jgi:hypothetical protein